MAIKKYIYSFFIVVSIFPAVIRSTGHDRQKQAEEANWTEYRAEEETRERMKRIQVHGMTFNTFKHGVLCLVGIWNCKSLVCGNPKLLNKRGG